jgi:hypothetical protein
LAYLKVAKEHNKREREKEKTESKPKRGRGSGHGYGYGRGFPPMHHGYHGGYHGGYPAVAGPSAYGSAPRMNRRETSRCNNCAEFGHFARECPKPPLPPTQK